MRDYLFVYPHLVPFGGAEAVAAWMLQSLSERGSVTVVTATSVNFEALDQWCETSLAKASSIETSVATWFLSAPLEQLGQPHDLWKFRYLVRRARQLQKAHRLCIAACNDIDLGAARPTYQYLHIPPTNDAASVRRQTYSLHSTPLMSLALKLYTWAAEAIAPWSQSRVTSNWTVANSQWTSQKFAEIYGRPADEVVYPPPLGSSSAESPKRPLSFLAIGRAHPQKGWEQSVEIIRQLRERVAGVTFSMYVMNTHEPYLRELQNLALQHANWLSLHIGAEREEIDRAIASHQFGIHSATDESYGMAVAEMLLGGCLTLVKEDGGQIEIVTEPELRFSDTPEAVAKLVQILNEPKLETRLRDSQRARKAMYTRTQFLQNFNSSLDHLEARALHSR